jgi:hypothetical protein
MVEPRIGVSSQSMFEEFTAAEIDDWNAASEYEEESAEDNDGSDSSTSFDDEF